MGEGVTNSSPAAESAASAVEEGPANVLWAACLKLVLLLGLSYVVVLRWRRELTATTPDEEDHNNSLENPLGGADTGPLDSGLESEDMEGGESQQQPDSFFTWDSGGSSGEYSFVHTAVELPKYPDGAISEEERQMLLLYMQTGRTELIPDDAPAVMCDQATARGFLETIVEETSDDLRSDCDEASVGWGSWDESDDDDRVTVVEMDQKTTAGLKREADGGDQKPTKREKHSHSIGYDFDSSRRTESDCYDLANQQLASLNCATGVNDCTSLLFRGVVVESDDDSVKDRNDALSDTFAKVSPSSPDFESLWISAHKMDSPGVEFVDPWSKKEGGFIPSPPDDVKFGVSDCGQCTDDDSAGSLLVSDGLCLVPSGMSNSDAKHNEEKLMFSDDFKDYFLPTDSLPAPVFDDKNEGDAVVPEEEVFSDEKVRCFRIGFESEPLEMANDDYYEKSSPANSEPENSGSSDSQQETLFSPRAGDVVYGSSWLGGSAAKKPEKTSAAEAPFPPMQSESPPPPAKSLHLFDQSASDDELQHVSNSLSRWQHHTDLQHLQEATSPITRWQHQTDLHKTSEPEMFSFSKQNYSEDEDTDDGLPPQLKQIYSSFKMKGSRGRIKIKEDKINDFKKLGLWDSDTKVTLPPFVSNGTHGSEIAKKESVREEELDDLELDMFSVNKNKLEKYDHLASADHDVDDALKSFNHLDDYSSQSEENSESENSYTVNTVENIDYDKEELSAPSTPDMSSLKHDTFNPCSNEHAKSENENSCSDNSDNCPLCTDPSFKKSSISDIFSTPTENKFLDTSVQSLLLNTFPKIKSLSPEDSKIPEKNGDSVSPLTSSDSDEGIRTAKDVKKRIKRRSKDSSSLELMKHDDSGYVEDDEDDDEDDSLEEKKSADPVKSLPEPGTNVRKSLSSAFYQSKSMGDLSAARSETGTPNSFEEFSSHLQQKSEKVPDGMIDNSGEKWDIPDNLSQFSAWLLDKELKKISTRDEMEKMIVNDIMSLREQTIATFLKNSCVEGKDELSPVQEASSSVNDVELLKDSGAISDENKLEVNESASGELSAETNSDSEKSMSDEILGDKTEHSSEELDSEYYNYNFNSNVSKILTGGNGIIVSNNNESKNNSTSLTELPDIISNIAEFKTVPTKSESNDYTLSYALPNPEIEIVKQNTPSEISNICGESNNKTFGNDISNTQTNAEMPANEKQQQSVLECVENDTECEKRAKVICTTAPMTSDEERVSVSGNLNESTAIDNKRDGNISVSAREVAPSVDEITNCCTSDINYLENGINENSSEMSELLCISSKLDSEVNAESVAINNDALPVYENANGDLFCSIIDAPITNAYIAENIIGTSLSDQNIDEAMLNEMNTKHSYEIQAPVDFADSVNEVAPSLGDIPNDDSLGTPGNANDLMISNTREAEGSCEGFSNEIFSPQAEAVSEEVDSEQHVSSVDYYHAHDKIARPVVNDNSRTLPPLDTLSDCVIVAESEELQAATPEAPENISDVNNCTPDTKELLSGDLSGEFLSFADNSDREFLREKSSKTPDRTSNLYKSKSVIVLQKEGDEEEEDDEFSDTETPLNSEISSGDRTWSDLANITKSVNDIDTCGKGLSKLQSSDDLRILPSEEKPRDAEYKRSRSVGREEEEESFESWTGQSKSTPDLSRCHEPQLGSSVPLSALLSKSVSQRIQDYLGRSTSVLSRSLPPNERSRHYRRICVSTETVVERAARFEARSKSGQGRDSSAESSRSGSCPPPSMRNGEALMMRGVRGYSKPTATVKPSVDSYRMKNAKKSEEDLFELITGYNQASRVTHKPPPGPSGGGAPNTIHQSLKSCRLKGKIASARKEFFEKLSQPDLSRPAQAPSKPPLDNGDAAGLRRFSEFRKSAREERARMAQSHPDLGALLEQAAVRSSRRRIDQLKEKRRQKSLPDAGPSSRQDTAMPGTTSSTKDGTLVLPYRRCTGEIAWASCARRLQEAKAQSKSQEPLEIVEIERRFKRPAAGTTRSLLRAHDSGYGHAAEGEADEEEYPGPAISGSDFSRARSMDFLLDNREGAEPPENRLAQKVKSEHELRIERSLQNLTLPDWYTQSKKPKEGFILRRGSEGSAGESRKRWLGFSSSSRTPSATSLTTPPSSSQRSIIIPKRITPTSGEWRYIGSLVSSRESLSPASLSPRECSSAAFNYGLNASLSRWSSSRLSTSSAPLTSASVHRSFRQPYLGWRAAAASSGGTSRTSPGVSPLNATTPLQGSRPGSPRRSSQDHQYGYGLQQNQITSAATLRPDGGTDGGGGSSDNPRISPLALYDNTTNVFFNSNIDHNPPPDFRISGAPPEMRRDRYSYTQSLYSGTVIVSPGTEFKPGPGIAEQEYDSADRVSMSRSPQPPQPAIWMESSFVGTKRDGGQDPAPQGRTIRIVPSDSVRGRSTCAPQTAMDTRELIDHLHNFLRGLQNRNQMIRPSSTSAFTPVSSSSNSGFHQDQTATNNTATTTTASTTATTTTHEDSHGSRPTSTNLNLDQGRPPNLVHYETEPRGAYPRGSWRRHSSSSSKDISPDNSSTDNELWLSVGEEMASHHSFSRTAPEHPDARSSSKSSISPPSPSTKHPHQQQKRASEDSTGSARPIFFASSRRGSKGSNHDPRSEPTQSHQQSSTNIADSSQNREELSRKSSSAHSEESGYFRRDSKSGGSNSWRDSRTDQESSSASKAERSSASMEEVLESLLAIPPSNSRSSSPTSPRRSRGHSLQLLYQQQQGSKMLQPQVDTRIRRSEPEVCVIQRQPAPSSLTPIEAGDEACQKTLQTDSGAEAIPEVPADDDQGKPFDASLIFPTFPCSTTSTNQQLFPLEEVNNHGSFCRSSSTSPLEDDVHSPTSMEVLVPEGEEQDLSSIIEDDTKLVEDSKPPLDHRLYHHHHPSPLQHECPAHRGPRPPLRRQSTLPSCSSHGSHDPLTQQQQQQDEEQFATNLFAGLEPGSYSRGLADHQLRRPQSLCLVLLHLPCMFCARALAPPPPVNSFTTGPARETATCVSEPGTPSAARRAHDSTFSFEAGPCCGEPVLVAAGDLTNVAASDAAGRGQPQLEDGKKKATAAASATAEGHLKCHRPRCSKSLPAEEARARFRTCPNCYTYYCSRQCRKLHLARHKDHCPQTRISNLCKQVLMKARDDPVSRRHLSLCARRGLLSRGRGAVKLLFLSPEDALDYLVKGWEAAKGQTLYVSRSDLLPQEMGPDVFSQVRSFCDKYNPERKFILLAAIAVTNSDVIAQALDREVVVRGAKMHLSPSLPEDDVQTLILTLSKTDPRTGDPVQSTTEERKKGLDGVVEQLFSRGVDVEKLYPHTFRKMTKFVEENEPFSPISIFPTDQRNGRVFMCIILPWADADIIVNISSKGGSGAAASGKSSKKKWMH